MCAKSSNSILGAEIFNSSNCHLWFWKWKSMHQTHSRFCTVAWLVVEILKLPTWVEKDGPSLVSLSQTEWLQYAVVRVCLRSPNRDRRVGSTSGWIGTQDTHLATLYLSLTLFIRTHNHPGFCIVPYINIPCSIIVVLCSSNPNPNCCEGWECELLGLA